jgi:hypothetical protein
MHELLCESRATIIEAIGSSNITIENLGPCVAAVVTGWKL